MDICAITLTNKPRMSRLMPRAATADQSDLRTVLFGDIDHCRVTVSIGGPGEG